MTTRMTRRAGWSDGKLALPNAAILIAIELTFLRDPAAGSSRPDMGCRDAVRRAHRRLIRGGLHQPGDKHASPPHDRIAGRAEDLMGPRRHRRDLGGRGVRLGDGGMGERADTIENLARIEAASARERLPVPSREGIAPA